MNNTEKLKQLQQKVAKTTIELQSLLTEHETITKRVNTLRRILSSTEKEIADINNGKLVVSEHSMLRFFQRVLGYDLEVIEAAISSSVGKAGVASLSTTEIPAVYNGVKFKVRIKNNVVVTVL